MVDHIESQRVFSFITFLSAFALLTPITTSSIDKSRATRECRSSSSNNTRKKKRNIIVKSRKKRQSNGGINVNSRNELTSPWNIYKSVNEHISFSLTLWLVSWLWLDRASELASNRPTIVSQIRQDEGNKKKKLEDWRKKPSSSSDNQEDKNLRRDIEENKKKITQGLISTEDDELIVQHWLCYWFSIFSLFISSLLLDGRMDSIDIIGKERYCHYWIHTLLAQQSVHFIWAIRR